MVYVLPLESVVMPPWFGIVGVSGPIGPMPEFAGVVTAPGTLPPGVAPLPAAVGGDWPLPDAEPDSGLDAEADSDVGAALLELLANGAFELVVG